LESRGLSMIRTADRFQLTGRVLLKFVD